MKGAEINAKDNLYLTHKIQHHHMVYKISLWNYHFSNQTPLHYASHNGDFSVVEYLVIQGATINEKNTLLCYIKLIIIIQHNKYLCGIVSLKMRHLLILPIIKKSKIFSIYMEHNKTLKANIFYL